MPASSARGLASLLKDVANGNWLLGSHLSQIREYCLVLVSAEQEQLGDAYDCFDKACEAFGHDCCSPVKREAVLTAATKLGEAFLALPDKTLQRSTA